MKRKTIRIITMCLIVSLCISLCSCGNNKKAFELSKQAYDDICAAYTIIEEMGESLYETWRISIFKDDELSTEYLSQHTHLSVEEIDEGVVYTIFSLATDADYETATEEEKAGFRNFGDAFFRLSKDNLSTTCLNVVSNAYRANGSMAKAGELLESAKQKMRELSNDYSDYEHYPSLKELYTTTQSFLDFCEDPQGYSFEQYSTTYNDYVTKARDYKNDLEYIFE